MKPQASRIRVVLVDDDVEIQRALTMAIEAAPDMRLLGVAGTRAQGLELLGRASADVLLVDLGLPDGSGIDVVRAAQVQWPECDIMVCTIFGDEPHVMRSIEAGARGYLLKDSSPQAILQEIRSLHAGGSPISPMIARQLLMRFRPPATAAAPDALPRDPRTALSGREREVLEYITKGYTAREIAELISVSHHTVLTYVRRIYAKLEVNSRAEAVYETRHLDGRVN